MPVQRSTRRPLVLVVAILAMLLALVAASPPSAGSADAERHFVRLINQTRAAAGLPALTVDPQLTARARAWAASMASDDHLAHSSNLAGGISAPWTILGENVGVHGVPDVGQLHGAFVASPGHHANIVDPRYTHVGVGVVVTEGGKLWTTHRFMAVDRPAPAPTAPPTTAATTITTAPVATTPVPAPTATPAPTPATTPVPSTAAAAAPDPTPPAFVPSTTTTTPTNDTSAPSSRPTDPPTPARSAEPDPSDPSDPATGGPTGRPASGAETPDDVPGQPSIGPGPPDVDVVEQLLIDLVEAGI